VEIDVLTGETTLLRTDILYDDGQSLNPCLDIGQIEGGFLRGAGLMLTEQMMYTHAIMAARRDRGDTTWPEITAPATVGRVQAAIGVTSDALRL
jgi:hypothetical protein